MSWGGQGGGLAYRLIAQSTKPTSPKDNDIWIQTTIPVSGVEVLKDLYEGYKSNEGFIQILANFGGTNPDVTDAKSVYNYLGKHQNKGTKQKMTISNILQTQTGVIRTITAERYFSNSGWVRICEAFAATINITYQVGCTCTCSMGSITLTAPNTNGSWSVVVPDAGTWTVSITNGEKSQSVNVELTSQNQVKDIVINLATVPTFTYSGSYALVDDNEEGISQGSADSQNWKIRLLSSGTLRFSDLGTGANGIDVFLVGGGGSGGSGKTGTSGEKGYGGGGGGGGVSTVRNISVLTDNDYSISIAADKGTSTAFGHSAIGGSNGSSAGWAYTIDGDIFVWGASGGSGGQGETASGGRGGNGGDADSWEATSGANGPCEFEEDGKLRYAGGGAGKGSGWGGVWSTSYGERSGAANTGGGGQSGSAGYSGIVIIRNARG